MSNDEFTTIYEELGIEWNEESSGCTNCGSSIDHSTEDYVMCGVENKHG